MGKEKNNPRTGPEGEKTEVLLTKYNTNEAIISLSKKKFSKVKENY